MSRHHLLLPCFLAAIILFPFDSAAQENTAGATSVSTINLLNPGFSYEQRLGKKQTVKLTAMMNVLVSTVFSSEFSVTNVYVDPAVEAGYRYYFNFDKRMNAGKRTGKNSGNYVSAYTQLFYSKIPVGSSYTEEKRRALAVTGLCWGMQRNYNGHFSLDLNLGWQYRFGRSSYNDDYSNTIIRKVRGEFLPAVELTLGIWLN